MPEMSRGPVLIMAGGTGGHVFPALAVAEVLRARGAAVEWLGTARGIEADVVPRAGIPLNIIDVSGLRGKGPRSVLLAPWKLLRALYQALALLRRLRPASVLGMGGFAAGPGGLAAWLLGRPLVIHEQNAVAGTTNTLLARFARRVLLGFPDALDGGEFVGNPVRTEISALPAPGQRWQGRSGPLRLLVLGGSLGAKPINELMPAALEQLPAQSRPVVRHQTGRGHDEAVAADYRQRGVDAEVQPFIEDMGAAYAWADLVLCRAGALTVAELCAAGVGAILVPLPHAIDDHQSANARWFVAGGAGRLQPQRELTPTLLAEQLRQLAGQRETLLHWAEAARALARPDAAAVVADHCVEVGHG